MSLDYVPDDLKEILKIGDETLEKELFLSEEDFKKLANPSYDLTKEKDTKEDNLKEAYRNIIDLLKKYCDLNPNYYPIIACWIIGTYSHNDFESYPYLYLNAMRGSGKSRTLKLITDLSKDGELQMSMTEAVLFRTKGTLGIDEFEGIGRRGNENLKELLNASYKKGTKVKRMKQKKTIEGVEQVVEEFEVYRPIVMANITGMEEVLGDRCISLIIEKSNNPKIIKLAEIWKHEEIYKKTIEILKKVTLCSCVVIRNCYYEWNNYVTSNYITTYNTQTTHNYINYTQVFKRLNLMDLDGRSIELCLPLLIIGCSIGDEALEELSKSLEIYFKEKKEDQFAESKDISFIDYVSQETESNWMYVREVALKFREFLQTYEDWLNPKWVGQALKRLKLRKDYKRERGGARVILDIEKAQQRIKMFK